MYMMGQVGLTLVRAALWTVAQGLPSLLAIARVAQKVYDSQAWTSFMECVNRRQLGAPTFAHLVQKLAIRSDIHGVSLLLPNLKSRPQISLKKTGEEKQNGNSRNLHTCRRHFRQIA